MRSLPDGHLAEALAVCVDLAAMGPQASLEAYLAEGHARMARAVGAQSGFVCMAAKQARPRADDPLFGWRIDVFFVVSPTSPAHVGAIEQTVHEEAYLHDPMLRTQCADAGRSRVYHQPDPRFAPETMGTLVAKLWDVGRLVDRLKAIIPVSTTTELYLGFNRLEGEARFGDADEDMLAAIVAGIKPWSERLALMLGRLDGHAVLSPREREVAYALLGHEPLKAIATNLSMSEGRARELVRAVYKKLGIHNRAELAHIWASSSTKPVNVRPTTTIRGRR